MRCVYECVVCVCVCVCVSMCARVVVVVVVVVVCVARFWGRSDSMIRPLIGVNEQPLLPCRRSHGM